MNDPRVAFKRGEQINESENRLRKNIKNRKLKFRSTCMIMVYYIFIRYKKRYMASNGVITNIT